MKANMFSEALWGQAGTQEKRFWGAFPPFIRSPDIQRLAFSAVPTICQLQELQVINYSDTQGNEDTSLAKGTKPSSWLLPSSLPLKWQVLWWCSFGHLPHIASSSLLKLWISLKISCLHKTRLRKVEIIRGKLAWYLKAHSISQERVVHNHPGILNS